MRSAVVLVGSIACVVAACSDPRALPPEPCNPLGSTPLEGNPCVTPWPSSVYQKADPTSPTGVRIDVPEHIFPVTNLQVELDVKLLAGRTGFPAGTQIITSFPGGVDPSNLPFWDHYERSLEPDSPTVLIDMSTGERVAHFAEVDANVDDDDKSDQALYIRPARRLKGGTRYAVGIRKSLRQLGGGELESPAGFEWIAHHVASSNAQLERARHGTERAIAALGRAGVPLRDLVVAWDFTTADDTATRADTLAARDAALAAMGDRGANLEVAITKDDVGARPDPDRIARRVLFTYQVPDVRESGDAGLARDAAGVPMVKAMGTAEGVAMIPACEPPAGGMPILIFGHGFFGGLDEAQGSYMRMVAKRMCAVVVAGVWRGMSELDLDQAAGALANPNHGIAFGERIVQGIIDFIALEQLSRGKLATQVLVKDGHSIVDPSKVYFLGISQGGILGSTLFAYDPFLTRAVIHVGGAEWSLLFERSSHWTQFSLLLTSAYERLYDVVLIEQLMQMAFDPTDPVNVVDGILTTPLPGTPEKHWLLQESDSDPSVSNLATELEARTMGLPLTSPALRVPYGLVETPGTLRDALQIFTERPTPTRDVSNITSETLGNVAHDNLRRRRAVVDQMIRFFATGEIVPACGAAVCDCAAGACGPLD